MFLIDRIMQLEEELKNSSLNVEKIDMLVRDFNKMCEGWTVSFKILPLDRYELTFKCYNK